MSQNRVSQEISPRIIGPREVPEEQALREVAGVARQLQMNEVELACWSLWLDRFQWHDPQLDRAKLLRVTAFQVKARGGPYQNSE